MKITRQHVEGDRRGSKNGYEIELPNGTIIRGSWKTGDKIIVKNGGVINKFDKAQINKNNDYLKDLRKKALEDALATFSKCEMLQHEYLLKKGLDSFVYVFDDVIYIPIYDFRKPTKVISFQKINKNGDKFFTKYLSVKYGFKAICIDKLPHHYDKIYMCEGFATALTIKKLTAEVNGVNVLCCFSAENLKKVAEYMYKAKLIDDSKIIIAADNDATGLKYANEAAETTGYKVIMPPWINSISDFNDLYQHDEDLVKKILNNA